MPIFQDFLYLFVAAVEYNEIIKKLLPYVYKHLAYKHKRKCKYKRKRISIIV